MIIPESWPVFLGLSVVLFGGAGFLMGQAIGESWRPWWQNLPYGLLLAAGCRFLTYALFSADLLSITGYLASAVVIIGLALLAWRLARVRRMIAQYPWLYERAGVFVWRDRSGGP
jgi:branched-chain amino acid transport system ATP-binding protein